MTSKNIDQITAPIHPALQPYLEHITIQRLELAKAHPTIPYQVLPSTSVVMGFQYRGRLKKIVGDKFQLLETCGISGLQTACRLFQNELATRTILVFFKPWSISAFFPESAHNYSNQAIGLNNLLLSSEIALLEDQLHSTADYLTLSTLVQNFLLNRLSMTNHKEIPANLVAAVNAIRTSAGIQSIATVAKKYGFSERTLERKFNALVGISPKKFSSLARFERAAAMLQTAKDWEELGYQLGYYDQPHFIHEFKRFTNLTPMQFTQSI